MDCNDVSYIAEQIKDAEMPPESDLRELKGLVIQLINPVLPQHQIETRAGSRPPTHDEIRRFNKITPMRRGLYDPTEDETIIHNWQSFCKLHNWDTQKVAPFLLLREGNKAYIRSKKERRKFAQFLADGLPDRTLYSVYHRFRTLFNNHVQRRYDPEEDAMILDHLENNPNLDEKRKYADLAKVLKRTRSSIWRRYKLLKKRRAEEQSFLREMRLMC